MSQREPIAIVGIGCRLPGSANDPRSFWRNLEHGIDAIVDVPEERWDVDAIYHPERAARGRTYARRGGFIDAVDRFDPHYFGISPREAASMDPQTRLLLELAVEALEDGGQVPARRAKSTGVFVGLSGSDYQDMLLADRRYIDGYTATGTAMSIGANRISHALDLGGPSMAVDTACSSSLVAVHLACQSLWQGESELALAGGACLLLRPEMTIGFSKGFMLSPDGRCKAFDARADGFVRGEGGAIVVLKPLSAALADDDRVYAVVLSTHVNQDGHTPTGIAVPNRDAQIASLERAYAKAGVDPRSVHYVEAHGPGTPVGDPIEMGALGAVLGRGRPAGRELAVGSVKTNIGHLEPAAGIAGLVKATLCLKHGSLVPNLHFETPSPAIPFEELCVRVPVACEPWPAGEGARIAGVNSFGFGGTNAHVVLGGAEHAAPSEKRARRASEGEASASVLVPLTAKSPEALRDLARSLREHVESDLPSLEALASTAWHRRVHHGQRLAMVARCRSELTELLEAYCAGEPRQGMAAGAASRTAPRVAFVFCGMGSHWWRMGRDLLATSPVFRAAIEELDGIFARSVPWSLLEELGADEARSRIGRFDIAQPAMFAVQVGLARVWRDLGVEPAAVVGHSVGEAAAAHVAGSLSLEDAAAVVMHRSRLQVRTQGKGHLLALGLSEAEAAPLFVGREGRVSVAAANSPGSVTLAGERAALEEIVAALEPRGVFCRFLRADVPAHSPEMEPLKPELVASLASIAPEEAAVPLYSTVYGRRISGAEHGAVYWGDNLREPVRFADAVAAMVADGIEGFVECSPHPVLANAIRETAEAAGAPVFVAGSLRREEPDRETLLGFAGELWTRGCPLDPTTLGVEVEEPIALPRYPWQRERCWLEPRSSERARRPTHVAPLLGSRLDHAVPTWELRIDEHNHTYLYDHDVQGAVIFPAAGFIEMALEACRELHGEGPALVEDVHLEKALFMPRNETTLARITLDPESGAFAVHGRPDGDESGDFVRCCWGRVRRFDGDAEARAVDLRAIERRCPAQLEHDAFYEKLGRMGDDFGPTFRGLAGGRRGDGESLGTVVPHEAVRPALETHQIHPAVLDACFQSLIANLPRSAEGSALPVHLGELRFHATPASERMYCHARLRGLSDAGFRGELTVCDEDGRVLLEAYGFSFRSLEQRATARRVAERGVVHGLRWEHAPAPGADLPALPSPSETADALAPVARDLAVALDRERHYREAGPALDRIARAWMRRALDELGVPVDAADPGDAPTLSRIAPSQRGALRRILDDVVADGAWSGPADDPEALTRELAPELAAYDSELSLLGRVGPSLAAVLRGETDALPLVFPHGDLDEVARLYECAPTAHLYNRLVAHAVRRAADALPPGHRLRVLEVGGGTCGTATHVLGAVAPERIDYLFTDISPAFLDRAERELGRHGVRTAVLDLEVDPTEQGHAPGSFDVIIAADVLHATRDVGQSLERLRALLAPGGQLALIELTRAPRWVDITFGLLEGWWRFDDERRDQCSPLLTPAGWRQALGRTGFADVRVLADTDEDRAEQCVILAAPAEAQVEVAGAPAPGDGTFVLVGERSAIADAIAARLEATGRTVNAGPGDLAAVLARGEVRAEGSTAHDARIEGIVAVGALGLGASSGGADLDGACQAGPGALIDIVQAIAASPRTAAPRLFVVTQRAEAVSATEDRIEPLQAASWGMTRVIANEHPELRPTAIDLGDGGGRELDALVRELAAGGPEDAVALRGGCRYVQRWRGTALDHAPAAPLASEVLAVSDDGRVTARPLPEPGEGEVRVAVRAAGGLGLGGPDDLRARSVAGVVDAVGRGVTSVRRGDAVVALVADGRATHVLAREDRLAPAPEGSFEEAASAAAGAAVAHRVVDVAARLGEREIVLVHGAATEIGLSCIRHAAARGATVLATASSEREHAMLRRQGAAAVHRSRAMDLPSFVAAETAGRGVDVLIVAAPVEGTRISGALLSRGGRLVEVAGGTSSVAATIPAGTSAVRIDLGELLEGPEIGPSLAAGLRVAARGLPHRVFPLSEASRASARVGSGARPSPVLSLADALIARPGPEASELSFAAEGTVLVTGGFGGFGLELARWLVRRGARHLALMGRSGDARPEARAAVASLREAGARVAVFAADVTSAADVRSVLDELARTMPPLRGVVHAAMVLEDAVVEKLDHARLARVFRPKVHGIYNLHELTLAQPLDFFVAFSSFAGLVGNPGQGAYAAANAVLDALMHERRRLGLPGLAVDWGSIGSVGYVAEHGAVAEHLSRIGLEPLETEVALGGLAELLARGVPQAAIISVDFSRWCAAHAAGRTPRFAHLAASDDAHAGDADGGTTAEGLRAMLRSASPEEGLAELVRRTRAAVARSLRMAADKVDLDRSLIDLGFDSLMAVELRSRLRDETGIDVPTMKVMGGPDVTELAAYLYDALSPGEARQEPVSERVIKPRAAAWFRRAGATDAPSRRLLCFPYNGGTAATYHGWEGALGEDVEVVTVRLPGQLDRADEPHMDLDPLVNALADELERQDLLGAPYAMYGHSLGALVAYALARELERREVRPPEHLVVGAFHAPHLPNPFPAHDRLTDRESLERLGMLEALASVLEDRDYLEAISPVVAGGMRLIESYRHDADATLRCAITVIGGDADAVVLPSHLAAWAEHTSGAFAHHQLRGNHLFVESDRDVVVALVRDALAIRGQEAVGKEAGRWMQAI